MSPNLSLCCCFFGCQWLPTQGIEVEHASRNVTCSEYLSPMCEPSLLLVILPFKPWVSGDGHALPQWRLRYAIRYGMQSGSPEPPSTGN